MHATRGAATTLNQSPNRTIVLEHCDNCRIKLRTRKPLQLGYNLVVMHGLSIRAVRHHRVCSVGDHDNPGPDGDLVSGQTVWGPAAVKVLVMGPHTLLDVPP